MKKCNLCQEEKPLEEFNKNSSSKDGKQGRCKPCSRKTRLEHYYENHDDERIKRKERSRVARARNQELLREYLNSHPCIDCGECDIVVLQFDHRNPAEKTTNIANALSNWFRWDRILKEIKKCDVRCANCHARKTAQQFGSWRIGMPWKG